MQMTAMPRKIGSELWDEKVPPTWDADREDTLICRLVRSETHDVKTFLFSPAKPSLFRFRPGQFITLDLNIGGETINRCYTISSSPTRPDTLSITVKRQPGGKVSNWLHDTMKPGAEIKVMGPSGDFSFTHHAAEKYLFLSGGSGVTPLMSMARTCYDMAADADVVFVHSARTPADIIYRQELASMEFGLPRFRTAFVCETAGDQRDWAAPTGYLTGALLETIAADFRQREIYCCGPDAYMKAVSAMLKDAGFDMAHYHQESFTFGVDAGAEIAAPAPTPAESASPAADGFEITFQKTGQKIICGPDQFILEAARNAGMRLPFSCTKGICSTCKTKKLSGEVEMKHGGGIRQREIDQGMILPCCSKPRSNITLDK